MRRDLDRELDLESCQVFEDLELPIHLTHAGVGIDQAAGQELPRRFYIMFAVVITASVQIVGIYLVFASLIIPALATSRLPPGNRLLIGYVIGGLSYFAGIVLSALFDLPTGAIIVWTMAAIALIAGFTLSGSRKID